MKNTEKELLDKGFKKEMLCVHIDLLDKDMLSGHRRLSYDLCDTFTSLQISEIIKWANKINEHFPDIKMFITGTGWCKPIENSELIKAYHNIQNQEEDGND